MREGRGFYLFFFSPLPLPVALARGHMYTQSPEVIHVSALSAAAAFVMSRAYKEREAAGAFASASSGTALCTAYAKWIHWCFF